MLVIERERLVVVVDLRQVRIGEHVADNRELAALAWFEFAGRCAFPAAFPLLLVLPLLRVTDAGLGFDVIEPGVLHALTRGPYVLAGHRTGVAADALVKIQHHADLCANFHFTCLLQPAWTAPVLRASRPTASCGRLRTHRGSRRPCRSS